MGSGLDSPIRLVRGADNSVRVPVQDSHGNITKVINGGSGATLFEAHYSPFGERAITNGSISSGDGSGQPFGFTGAEHDSVSELVYMRNRYYAPGLGRFISEDPIGFEGGENFYAYCHNDPINFSDPLGLYSTRSFISDMSGYGPDIWQHFGDPHVWADGLDTGLNNMLAGVTGDLYNGGAYRCYPGAELSRMLGGLAKSLLIQAATMYIADSGKIGEVEDLARGGQLELDLGVARDSSLHGNSLDNTDPGHVYAIYDKEMKRLHRIGESSGKIINVEGIDKSARAEVQVRRLNRDVGETRYRSRIITRTSNKAESREIETRLIRLFKYKNNGIRPPGNENDR